MKLLFDSWLWLRFAYLVVKIFALLFPPRKQYLLYTILTAMLYHSLLDLVVLVEYISFDWHNLYTHFTVIVFIKISCDSYQVCQRLLFRASKKPWTAFRVVPVDVQQVQQPWTHIQAGLMQFLQYILNKKRNRICKLQFRIRVHHFIL